MGARRRDAAALGPLEHGRPHDVGHEFRRVAQGGRGVPPEDRRVLPQGLAVEAPQRPREGGPDAPQVVRRRGAERDEDTHPRKIYPRRGARRRLARRREEEALQRDLAASLEAFDGLLQRRPRRDERVQVREGRQDIHDRRRELSADDEALRRPRGAREAVPRPVDARTREHGEDRRDPCAPLRAGGAPWLQKPGGALDRHEERTVRRGGDEDDRRPRRRDGEDRRGGEGPARCVREGRGAGARAVGPCLLRHEAARGKVLLLRGGAEEALRGGGCRRGAVQDGELPLRRRHPRAEGRREAVRLASRRQVLRGLGGREAYRPLLLRSVCQERPEARRRVDELL